MTERASQIVLLGWVWGGAARTAVRESGLTGSISHSGVVIGAAHARKLGDGLLGHAYAI